MMVIVVVVVVIVVGLLNWGDLDAELQVKVWER